VRLSFTRQKLSHQTPLRTASVLSGVCLFVAAFGLLAADRAFVPYQAAKPILKQARERFPEQLPEGLRDTAVDHGAETQWLAWSRQRDKTIRARLQQGDLDSMVNLLLLGTSFTKQPRIRMESLDAASKSGILRARVDDLVAGLRQPGDNERLLFLQKLVRAEGIDPADSNGGEAGRFLYRNLLRVAQERRALAERSAQAAGGTKDAAKKPDDPASLLERHSLFRDRGLSLDTSILPDFLIEQALRDLKKRGMLREGQVARVAVVGPGLDFIDKNEESAFDYYPQQTLQPFALYDSLVRLGLAGTGTSRAASLSVSVLDISTRVIDHLERTRERARKGIGYSIQLPRDLARPWPSDLIAYWKALGDQAGAAVEPTRPPEIFPGLETRAVRIRPATVLACAPVDLDIVLERLNLPERERFDLIVGTNIFVYYDAFEQMLALENAGAMLKPGGLLLTNDRLPELPGGSMRLAGVTEVRFDAQGGNARDVVGWYKREP
jgi:SAM-dependent methyltransferase